MMSQTNQLPNKLTQARTAAQQKNFQQAFELYHSISKDFYENADALLECGYFFASTGKLDEAESAFSRVIQLQPSDARAYYLSGSLQLMKQQHAAAVSRLKKALQLDPMMVDASKDLGTALYHSGEYSEAVEHYESYLKVHPGTASVVYNMGLVWKELGQFARAEACFREVLVQMPRSADVHASLGHVLNLQAKYEESESQLNTALKLDPKHADARFSLGMVYRSTMRYCKAEQQFRLSLEHNPQHALAGNSLGCVLSMQGKVEDAVDCFRRQLGDAGNVSAHSNLLLTMHYRHSYTKEDIFDEHRRWADQHTSSVVGDIVFDDIDKDPHKRLRIGFLSANLCRHSVAYFLFGMFRNLDQDACEIHCYSDTAVDDAVSEQLRLHAASWNDVREMSNEELSILLRQDKMDILVDLAGHTDKGYSRLGLLAQRPVPIQFTYLGYPDTTGLNEIDYRLTDSVADPAGQERFSTEKLIYLDTGFLCYTPPEDAPTVTGLPVSENGYITFGSFNTLAKVSPEALDVWVDILDAVPLSRLLLKSQAFTDEEVKSRYRQMLLDAGVEEKRIDLRGWEPDTGSHLSIYNQVDIALDPFPYNGTTTSCEALWMGVPVITVAGDRHCGHVGASIMTAVGLQDLIADDVEQYTEIAVRLAEDTAALGEMRASMRARMESSRLCDGVGFSRQLEQIFRRCWQRWCDSD